METRMKLESPARSWHPPTRRFLSLRDDNWYGTPSADGIYMKNGTTGHSKLFPWSIIDGFENGRLRLKVQIGLRGDYVYYLSRKDAA